MGLRDLLQNDLTGFNFNTDLSAIEPWASYEYDQTDIPRMRAGGQGGQVNQIGFIKCFSLKILFSLVLVCLHWL